MKIREYNCWWQDCDELGQTVKRYRLMRLRGKYEFDYEVHIFLDKKSDRVKKGFKRVFYDAKRPNDCAGFAEFFDTGGRPLFIDFYDDDGEVTARINLCSNPALWWNFYPTRLV